ncbi:MAG: ribonuclease HII [Candidatus Verstraetearchaeota archaeon]|nr:ribonuclease HII [Candidatus Verstraetearchaeota archaeon]
MRRITGIDEAGRGPVIGPMVIAGVLIKEEDIPKLIEKDVRDSKKLASRRRAALAQDILEIAEAHYVKVYSAEEIDALRKSKSLNRIEAEGMAEIIKKLLSQEAQLGSVDVIEERFGAEISRLVGENLVITSSHHAEDKYPAVSAASIIAKTTRDRLVAELRKEFGDFGSGYPSDPKTVAFIRSAVSRGEIPPIIRKTWKTFTKITRISFPDP